MQKSLSSIEKVTSDTIQWFVKEHHFLYNTYDSGWGNGYVIIPKGWPGFGMEYDELHTEYDIEVHGGLTFSSSGHELKKEFWGEIDDKYRTKDYWVIGFDTAHLNDTSENCPKEYVEKEAARLAFRFYELKLLEMKKENNG